MTRTQKLAAWGETQKILIQLLESESTSKWREEFENVAHLSEINNPWFTRNEQITSLKGIITLLEPEMLEKWSNAYPEKAGTPKDVGVIMAGNIPLAGFHDFLCVLLSGNNLIAKLSGSDKFLLPYIAKIYFSLLPEMQQSFKISDQLKNIDAVIATGSNNTSRYFEYYFGNKPHIFRKNRNSAAIITGDENEFDFILLGRDIFTYFGLGCRNVSKLYVPLGYSFNEFFNNMVSYSSIMQHTKYMNNFDYHQTLFLMNRKPFLTNNFLILKEDKELSTPVSVLNYEFYTDEADLSNKLKEIENEMQCVVSKKGYVKPGQAQFPSIFDYADGVDTMEFLSGLS
ncbi:MAG: acyl-CoA reductase [Bacteroidetes bacterium]|nr:acyl-CoA reductase [Bacteroidota bacterium]